MSEKKKLPVKYKWRKKREEKLSKFEIFQIILAVYNAWSFLVMTCLRYLSSLKLLNDAEVLSSHFMYNFVSSAIGWYANGITLLLTYMICSAIMVFSFYSYLLQVFGKAKWFFKRPSRRYLLLMGATALLNTIMFLLMVK